MKRLSASVIITVAITFSASMVHADSDLFGAGGLDPSFCQQENARQTVVYIDDMMMVEGKQDWATKLAGKLRATLAPGERVTVVRLSPASGQSKEIWNGCWPEYTQQAREKIEKERYFFSRSPLTTLQDQKKFFMRDLDRALVAIYVATRRPPTAARIDPQHPPEKNLIRALAFDEGRFAQARVTVRSIVYSDLAENSDLGSVFKPFDAGENYGRKLGTYLRRSVFYAYGIGEDLATAPTLLEQIRRFWDNALRSMNASVGGIGTDLNMQNAVPSSARTYIVNLKRDQQMLEGRLSILYDADGNLIDSWLQIPRLSITGLNGSFRCQGTGDEAPCKLAAKTMSGLVTQNAEEDVILEGAEHEGLSGQVGVKGALTYAITATRAEN